MAAVCLSVYWRRKKTILQQITKINELNTTMMLNCSSITGSHVTSVNNGNGTTSRLTSTKLSAPLGHAVQLFTNSKPCFLFSKKVPLLMCSDNRMTNLPFATAKYQLENSNIKLTHWWQCKTGTTGRNHRRWTLQLIRQYLWEEDLYFMQYNLTRKFQFEVQYSTKTQTVMSDLTTIQKTVRDQKKPIECSECRSFTECLQREGREPTWAQLTLEMQQASDKTCKQTTLHKQEPNAPCSNTLSH